MKIKVRQDLCCGAGLCAKAAPGVFQLDELGYNKMDEQEVPPGLEEAARSGTAVCPEGAIRLVGAKKTA